MKILPFKIPKTVHESFRLQTDRQPYFYDNLHQHPEFQLTLIFKGEGELIVGDYIGPFEPGDLFLIGPDLPHVFRCDPQYYRTNFTREAHSISVFFDWGFWGEKFLSLPEMSNINEFFKESENGLRIKGDARTAVSKLMEELFTVNNVDRLIILLKILDVLSLSSGHASLASAGTFHDFDEDDGRRLDAIYRFTINEYHRKIGLDEVAAVSNMTVNSFCRYFKKRTRKSYIRFLNELRIAQACKLLQQKDTSISQVGLEVGFSNLSNFNRKFKEIKKCTPTEFRNQQAGTNG